MNYSKIYNQLIESRKERGLIKTGEEYYEIHHIIPKCMGGSNDTENLVLLTAREHVLAHILLAKIYPNNIKIIQSTSAILMKNKYRVFSNGKRVEGPDGTVYESIRECARKLNKDFSTIKKWIEKYPELGYRYIY